MAQRFGTILKPAVMRALCILGVFENIENCFDFIHFQKIIKKSETLKSKPFRLYEPVDEMPAICHF